MSNFPKIESVYNGLLETVRRVDNFPKPKSDDNELSVEDILVMIDSNLLKLIQQEYDSSYYDADYKAGKAYGAMEALESLKENILDLKNKGD